MPLILAKSNFLSYSEWNQREIFINVYYIMEIDRGEGVKLTPAPRLSWDSGTSALIGLIRKYFYILLIKEIIYFLQVNAEEVDMKIWNNLSRYQMQVLELNVLVLNVNI